MENQLRLLEDALICHLCNKILSEPKTLPCQHTFCHSCCEVWLEKRKTKHLTCSLCLRQFTSLSLYELPVDPKVTTLIKMLNSMVKDQETLKDHSHKQPLKGILKKDSSSSSNSSMSPINEEEEQVQIKTKNNALNALPQQTIQKDKSRKAGETQSKEFEKIFLENLLPCHSFSVQTKNDIDDPFIHDIVNNARDHLFVVDYANNMVKCYDSQSGFLQRHTSRDLCKNPIGICRLPRGTFLLIEMSNIEDDVFKVYELSEDLYEKAELEGLNDNKSITVIKQMYGDNSVVYMGDKYGRIHQIYLNNRNASKSFQTKLNRIFHMSADNGLVAVNDGLHQGKTSKAVHVYSEIGELKFVYKGTPNHRFRYHSGMTFHGDYLLICDFWEHCIHVVFTRNAAPVRVYELKSSLQIYCPGAIAVTTTNELVICAKDVLSKKTKICVAKYLK